MHWAIHGHTVAELIAKRVDSEKPNMGLSNWKGTKIRKSDVSTAKNYLNEEELKALNLIVEQYLAFGELQALNRKPMYMADWIKKLNDFMQLNERDVLEHAGRISAKLAKELAYEEYEKYNQKRIEFENTKHAEELENELKRLKGKQ